MLVGYARTSTLDQIAGLAGQQRDLAAVGCERVFVEQVSSVDMTQRGALSDAVEFCRAGDTLVVTRLDRLARSVAHLMEIVKSLDGKGVALRILGMDIDTATPTGKLMLAILGGVAEFEREIMLERQREGIAKAKAAGKYQGRKPTARAKAADILRLQGEGLGATDIARQLRIGRASVYRVLSDHTADRAKSPAL